MNRGASISLVYIKTYRIIYAGSCKSSVHKDLQASIQRFPGSRRAGIGDYTLYRTLIGLSMPCGLWWCVGSELDYSMAYRIL